MEDGARASESAAPLERHSEKERGQLEGCRALMGARKAEDACLLATRSKAPAAKRLLVLVIAALDAL